MDSETIFSSLSNQFYHISEIYHKAVISLEDAFTSTRTLLYQVRWLPIDIVNLLNQKTKATKEYCLYKRNYSIVRSTYPEERAKDTAEKGDMKE